MKKNIRKINTKIRYELQLLLQRLFPPKNGGVLVFHEVVGNLQEAVGPDYAISINDFNYFVEELINNNIECGTFDKGIQPGKIYFTFDDGYECNIYTASKTLNQREIEHVIFVPLDNVDKEKYISIEQLKMLSNSRYIKIGGHSKSHCQVRYCSSKQLIKEIYKSKKELEEIIGKNVDYFAFPYGSLTAVGRRGIKVARNAGFRYAFSTLCLDNTIFNNRWFYPRITVTSTNYLYVLERLKRGMA